jgi:hypothetical protein
MYIHNKQKVRFLVRRFFLALSLTVPVTVLWARGQFIDSGPALRVGEAYGANKVEVSADLSALYLLRASGVGSR